MYICFCNFSGCHDPVLSTNPKTGNFYHYCDKHRKLRNDTRSERYLKRKEKELDRANARVFEIKMKFFDMYGKFCDCCGETDIYLLSLEHILGGGKQHRKIKTGIGTHLEVVKEYRPDLYKTLCYNCNFAKGVYGQCPHVCDVIYEHELFLKTDSISEKNRKRFHNMRVEFFQLYGNQCVFCNEVCRTFLSLDHINGGGRKHRSQRGGNYAIYKDAITNVDKSKYQILCYNCNFSKERRPLSKLELQS